MDNDNASESDSSISVSITSNFVQGYIPTNLICELPMLHNDLVVNWENEKQGRYDAMQTAKIALEETSEESKKILLADWHSKLPQTIPQLVANGLKTESFWKNTVEAEKKGESKNDNRDEKSIIFSYEKSMAASKTLLQQSSQSKSGRHRKRLRKKGGTQLRWDDDTSSNSEFEDAFSNNMSSHTIKFSEDTKKGLTLTKNENNNVIMISSARFTMENRPNSTNRDGGRKEGNYFENEQDDLNQENEYIAFSNESDYGKESDSDEEEAHDELVEFEDDFDDKPIKKKSPSLCFRRNIRPQLDLEGSNSSFQPSKSNNKKPPSMKKGIFSRSMSSSSRRKSLQHSNVSRRNFTQKTLI